MLLIDLFCSSFNGFFILETYFLYGLLQMTDWLLDKPLLSLTPTQKAACLAFLCNELLSSKSIYG